jgi:inorganic pyrophosphatase
VGHGDRSKCIERGKNPPHEINVVIEIPKGSNIKYEIGSEAEGVIFVDRILSTSMSYLCNYGFIPKTKEDGDPVDMFVLSNNK